MDNKVKNNILYVTTRLPWPLVGGDRLHIYHYLSELKKRGYNITLVTLVSPDDDLEGAQEHNEFYTKLIPVPFNKKLAYLNAIKAAFNDKPFIVEYFYSRAMQKAIDKEIKTSHYDLIIGYIIRSLPYIKKYKNIKKVIHLCDSYTMLYERRIKEQKSWFDKLKISIEYLKVKHYENLACKISDKQILISESDSEHIASFVKNPENLKVIGWATDTDYYVPQTADKINTISFVGSMQYIPNSEAAMYFATEVFPLIKKEIPDAKFKIIGAKPRQELFDATKGIEGIEITGRVEDVRECMKECKVSVCPTKIASGIQSKILEAMSMGIPTVTTPAGAEGVGANEQILPVARTNEEYAQKVIELMKNQKLNDEISKKSREFIIENFSWDKVGDDWDKVVKEVINAKK